VARIPGKSRRSGPETHRWVSLVLLGGGVQSVLRILLAATTARLISPADTGLFQLALSLVLVAVAIGDPGLAEAAVRRPAQTRISRDTFFAVNVGLGCVIGLALLAVAGPLARGLGVPESRPLIMALAILPPFATLSLGPLVELRRSRRFRDIAMIEVLATFMGCAACMVLALRGAGAWALFAYQAAWSITRLVGVMILAPVLPRPIIKLRALRPVARFASNVWAARLADMLVSQLDKVVIGALLGTLALGLYSRAYLLVALPLNLIGAAVTTVLVPALARAATDGGALKREFLATTEAIATVTLPAFIGAAALASPLVGVMFGRGRDWNWAEVATLLAIMAPVAALDSLGQPQRSLMIARGRAGLALGVSLASGALVITGIAIGAQHSLIGAAWGYAAATVTDFLICSALALPLIGVSPGEYVLRLLRTAAAAGAMCAVLVLLRPVLAASRVPEALQLVALVACGGLVYLTLLGWARLGRVFGWARSVA
jgi:O-antigen/teichoic acid export membrane protein